ncbi:MAG: hypothetical protein JSV13_03865 [Nitrospiraceae bacterium]|nr:MAG: hypothetical protein JSV13_03865 [Nitrospiraceae bacterium]
MENKDVIKSGEYAPGTLLIYSFLLAIIPVALFLHPAYTGNIFGDMLKPYTYNLIYWGPLFFFIGLVLAIKAFFRFRSYKSFSGQMLSIFSALLNLAIFLIDINYIRSTLGS